MEFGEKSGNAVAIDSRRALTALHSSVAIGTDLSVRTQHGNLRMVKVVFCLFVEQDVDIAVIELDTTEPNFEIYVSVARRRVFLGQNMTIFGMKKNNHDELGFYRADCQANYIDPNESSAIIQSDYTGHDGLSGAGVITVIEDGQHHLVGIHVASGDNTSVPPHQEKKKRTVQMLSEDMDSLTSDLNGHRSHTLICEAFRVNGLHTFLFKTGG